MLNRHRFAVALAIICGVSPSLATRQVNSPDQGKQIRQFLKLRKEHASLVAFMDFQCPSCQKNWPAIKAALKRHPDVRFYSISFPLTHQHKNAFDAAVAYEIARSSGAQTAVYDGLLSGKQKLDRASLNAYLKSHRLPAIVGGAKAAEFEAKVSEQLKFATTLGINKTPTLVLIDASGAATELAIADNLDSRLP